MELLCVCECVVPLEYPIFSRIFRENIHLNRKFAVGFSQAFSQFSCVASFCALTQYKICLQYMQGSKHLCNVRENPFFGLALIFLGWKSWKSIYLIIIAFTTELRGRMSQTNVFCIVLE